MKILVLNAGSSSLKFQLIEMDGETVIAKGNVERIGAGGHIKYTATGRDKIEYDADFPTHTEAFQEVAKLLTEGETRVIDSPDEIYAVGHRVLHGSELYKKATWVTDKVIEDIDSLRELGPLHNPPQAATMRACRQVFGKDKPNVAVFDTSFHQTMPPKAYIFPIPYKYYEKYSIRRYGFHGTSHRYVSLRYFELMGIKDPTGTKLVVCHLGNGSSLSAIKDGKVIDTSMGLTPLDGFEMGTRCGGIDPSVVTYIENKEHLTPDQMSEIMNKESGLIGVSGISSDHRDLIEASEKGNERAELALEILEYQVKKFIGAYAAAMGGLDAILFAGGIAENDPRTRKNICAGLEFLGVKVDEEENKKLNRHEGVISTPDSRVKVMIIPTNEEIMIARDTVRVVEEHNKS